MKVVILCGGKGTRIRGVRDDIPKPMIPLGESPILWHIMKYYAEWGHNDFVLCLGYKGEVIKDYFLNYESRTRDFTIDYEGGRSVTLHSEPEIDWSVTMAETGYEAKTGARVSKIEQYVQDDESFMLTYGDGVGDIDLDGLVDFHESHDRIMTVTGVRPPSRFGEMRHTEEGLVTEFNEKPQAVRGRISGGYFICRTEIFDYLDDRDELIFEEEPMNQLVADNEMMVYEHDGFWQPMDNPRDYRLLNNLWQEDPPWAIWK